MRHARLVALALLLGGCAQTHPGQKIAILPPQQLQAFDGQQPDAPPATPPAAPSAAPLAQPPRAEAAAARSGGPEPFRSEIAITLPGRGAEGARDISTYHEADQEGDWTYQFLEFKDVVGDRESYLRITNVYAAPILASGGWRFWEAVTDPKRGEVGIVPVRRAVDCDWRVCRFTEVVDVSLHDLNADAVRRGAVPLTLKSKSGETKTLVMAERLPTPAALPAPERVRAAPAAASGDRVVCRENGTVLPRTRSECLQAGGAVLSDIAGGAQGLAARL